MGCAHSESLREVDDFVSVYSMKIRNPLACTPGRDVYASENFLYSLQESIHFAAIIASLLSNRRLFHLSQQPYRMITNDFQQLSPSSKGSHSTVAGLHQNQSQKIA